MVKSLANSPSNKVASIEQDGFIVIDDYHVIVDCSYPGIHRSDVPLSKFSDGLISPQTSLRGDRIFPAQSPGS
jgi:hypothetical protein